LPSIVQNQTSAAALTGDAHGSVLLRLELTPAQRQSLARQGCITQERRGARKQVFKLRLRHEGQVIVRYLTTNPEVAERARQELQQLQRNNRASRALRRIAARARRILRRIKTQSAPYLQAEGFVYHGYQLRRPRRGQANEPPHI
jgi:hypothetical protein